MARRRFRGYGQQAGPCWTDVQGVVNCPEGYHVDSETGRVVADRGGTQTNWTPVVQAGTGLVTALINAATGQQYNYQAGQYPVYQPGATYRPPKKWYEEIPFWGWLLGGGLVVGMLARRR
jgi:hypothetical protein